MNHEELLYDTSPSYIVVVFFGTHGGSMLMNWLYGMLKSDMELTDTHCHIHEMLATDEVGAKWHSAGKTDPVASLIEAKAAGVTRLICVGCSLSDSRIATEFTKDHANLWTSIGIHPHEAQTHLHKDIQAQFAALAANPEVIAIGECGLDYFYDYSPKEAQVELLHFQLQLAQQHHLPMIFHVREAFDDFWPIFDSYPGITGVIHSFTADSSVLRQILARNLYVGLNGIMTFTKDEGQLQAATEVPLERLLLETDAPFLTPKPYRGTICEPKHVRVTAEFLADLRNESLEELATATTRNARQLFSLPA